MSEIESLGLRVDQLLCTLLRGRVVNWPAQGDVDFEREFLDRAAHHGVQGLVYNVIEEGGGWKGWPARIRTDLLNASRVAASFDMLRSHAFKEIQAALAAKNIPVLIIKGGALASSLYEHSRLRTRCDTDLFIRFTDIERVRNILAALGLEIVGPIYKSHQFVCTKRWNGASVDFDMHWRILNAPQFARMISFDEAWGRSVPLYGIEGARTLDEADALLLACLHRKGSEFHDENRLIWLYDIHLLASSFSVQSWIEFANRTVEKCVQNQCLEGLTKSRDCFSTEIPPEVIRAFDAPYRPHGKFASSNLALLIDDLRSLPGWSAKSGLLRELFLPSPRSLIAKYNESNRVWLPILYCRQLLGGIVRRLTLQ